MCIHVCMCIHHCHSLTSFTCQKRVYVCAYMYVTIYAYIYVCFVCVYIHSYIYVCFVHCYATSLLHNFPWLPCFGRTARIGCKECCPCEAMIGNILAMRFLSKVRIGCKECCPCANRDAPASSSTGNTLACLRGPLARGFGLHIPCFWSNARIGCKEC